MPNIGGLGADGGVIRFDNGGGGGADAMSLRGGGGGGTPFDTVVGAKMSISSSLPRSVKSKSHKFRDLLRLAISSSHLK